MPDAQDPADPNTPNVADSSFDPVQRPRPDPSPPPDAVKSAPPASKPNEPEPNESEPNAPAPNAPEGDLAEQPAGSPDGAAPPATTPALPTRHLPDPDRLRVLDQGSTGAAVGFALAATLNLLRAERGIDELVSPEMIYALAKRFDAYPDDVGGTSLEAGIK